MDKVTVFTAFSEGHGASADYGPHVFSGALSKEEVAEAAKTIAPDDHISCAVWVQEPDVYLVTYCTDPQTEPRTDPLRGERFHYGQFGCGRISFTAEVLPVTNLADSPRQDDDPPPLPEPAPKKPAELFYANIETSWCDPKEVAVTLYFSGNLPPTAEQIILLCRQVSLPVTVDPDRPEFKFIFCPNPLSMRAGLCRVQCYT